MDPGQFFATSRLVIVAGKGGVGKTTVSAALARSAARTGLTTLIIEVEGKSGLASMFGQPPLGYDEVVLSPGGGPSGAADVLARTLTPDDALIEYLEDHGLRRISKRLVSSGAVDVVATAAPGIKDILLLGKVKQLERAGNVDLVVLDAPRRATPSPSSSRRGGCSTPSGSGPSTPRPATCWSCSPTRPAAR